MRAAKNIFANIDQTSLLLYAILMLFGWVNIYASQYNEDTVMILDFSTRYGKQLLFIGMASLLAFLILIIDWKFPLNISIQDDSESDEIISLNFVIYAF